MEEELLDVILDSGISYKRIIELIIKEKERMNSIAYKLWEVLTTIRDTCEIHIIDDNTLGMCMLDWTNDPISPILGEYTVDGVMRLYQVSDSSKILDDIFSINKERKHLDLTYIDE